MLVAYSCTFYNSTAHISYHIRTAQPQCVVYSRRGANRARYMNKSADVGRERSRKKLDRPVPCRVASRLRETPAAAVASRSSQPANRRRAATRAEAAAARRWERNSSLPTDTARARTRGPLAPTPLLVTCTRFGLFGLAARRKSGLRAQEDAAGHVAAGDSRQQSPEPTAQVAHCVSSSSLPRFPLSVISTSPHVALRVTPDSRQVSQETGTVANGVCDR